ncbi:MAG: ABC transporter ATP-binding protein/permease [Actinomycetes bacterium]|jgi:ATP-binding cassette subfamily B protein|nr:ABC transporter ATP-binding protein/permease [Actinomycetes bacterium]
MNKQTADAAAQPRATATRSAGNTAAANRAKMPLWPIFKRLLKMIIAPRKGRFFFSIGCSIFSSAVVAYNMTFTKTVIDRYITPMLSQSNPDFSNLYRAVGGMVIILSLGFLANLGYSRTMAILGQEFQRAIRDEMFSHMQTLPIGYFDRHSFGDVMSYYTNDTDTLRQMISQAIPQLVVSGFFMLTVAVMMYIVNVWLALLVTAIIVIDYLVARFLTGRSGRFFRKQQESLGLLNGYVEETMSGQKVVKVFSHEDAAMADFDVVNDELFDAAYQANNNANILMPIIGNIGYLQYILIVLVGAVLMLSGFGGVTLGTIGTFIQAGRGLSNNFGQAAMQTNFVIMALAGAGRIFQHMDEQSEQDSGTVHLVNVTQNQAGGWDVCTQRTGHWAWQDGDTLIPLDGAIRLDSVNFSYVPGKQILHDITMYAEPGQKVALIGATGAGKTTITNLINRFYDIDSGSITYDGLDISRINKTDLRHSLGIVLQDTALFTGTVYDNIRYGRLDATDEEIVAAAKLANADRFISSLPHGYDTQLSGNSEDLSQGQRQLLAIARAALSDPPVMVLDEATSSIDTRTEALVQSGMDALMKGRTVFVIAHRLSTIVNSDVIMVMDHGRIIERGNHNELMEKRGRYYQLYTGVFDLV